MYIEDVRLQVSELLENNINDYYKLLVKCWEYHSESRIKNGNKPVSFENYIHGDLRSVVLNYIEDDLIDFSEFGNKKNAKQIVIDWDY